ncbi:MAG: hypothetical protein OXI44_05920 [Bacteroidota bacterium]|nr:hypothetical protein [Bacteroidota bacterium]
MNRLEPRRRGGEVIPAVEFREGRAVVVTPEQLPSIDHPDPLGQLTRKGCPRNRASRKLRRPRKRGSERALTGIGVHRRSASPRSAIPGPASGILSTPKNVIPVGMTVDSAIGQRVLRFGKRQERLTGNQGGVAHRPGRRLRIREGSGGAPILAAPPLVRSQSGRNVPMGGIGSRRYERRAHVAKVEK